MPFFSAKSLEKDVEKATSEASTAEEDLNLMSDICDRVQHNTSLCKPCLYAITKRVQHHVPLVGIRALTLLDECVQRCGKPFQLELCTKQFMDEIINVLKKAHPKVGAKLKAHMVEWCGEFNKDMQLMLLHFIIQRLKEQDIEFPEPGSQELEDAKAGFEGKEVANQKVGEQEDIDLAKAIELSLQDTRQAQQRSEVMTLSQLPPPSVSSTVRREVRALYDFEAAEDNELSFHAGDIITVLDDSDLNWWKGEFNKDIGLFPSSFVTADLTVEPEPEVVATASENTQTDSENIQSESSPEEPEVICIDEERMDWVLRTLQTVDPTVQQPDSPDMLRLEESCHEMGPLIDKRLEEIDSKHSELMQLNTSLMEAMELYGQLMSETSVYADYKKNQAFHPVQAMGLVQDTGMPPPNVPYMAPQGYIVPQDQGLNQGPALHCTTYSVPGQQQYHGLVTNVNAVSGTHDAVYPGMPSQTHASLSAVPANGAVSMFRMTFSHSHPSYTPAITLPHSLYRPQLH
uniref:signal transducing adapter molecule 1-like isoform X1 n=2 Tax=Myxine glutinosa TaxID=7769 RepID=UPI0035901567